MPWWSWMTGGAILLGAELFLVDAQFYLVFLGTAALLAGAACLAAPQLPFWAQLVLFAALAIASMAGFRARIYARLRGRAAPVPAGPHGGTLELPVALAPGATCQAEHGGSFWTVRNGADRELAAGARVRIVAVQGLTLVVRPEPE